MPGLKLRLKSILDAIEVDLHRALIEQVAPIVTTPMLLDSHYNKAVERAKSTSDVDETHLADFIDFGDILQLLSVHIVRLDDESAQGIRAIRTHIEGLLPIRNRVAHAVRSLEPTDHEEVFHVAALASASTFPTPELTKTLADSEYFPEVRKEFTAQLSEYSLHNLPRPEFDDTGLIGRTREKQQLLKSLVNRRETVYTLVGSGGLGKTALAIGALSELVVSPECPYDLILWTSLKTERLTGEGVEELASSLSAITGLEASVSEVFSESGDGLEWMARSLEGFEVLVVIDNLETTDANELLTVYDELPTSCTFLVTSREGIGQLERRIPVTPLSDGAAARLLRAVARIHDVDWLATADQSLIAEVCADLRNSPLAIRWYVLGVSAGVDPNARRQDQHELLRFCVDSVWQGLSERARSICKYLAAMIGKSARFSELVVFIDEPADVVRRVVHELQERALITIAVEEGSGKWIGNVITLTETAGDYIASVRPVTRRERERARRSRQNLEEREAQLRARAPRVDLSSGSVYLPETLSVGAAPYLVEAARSRSSDDAAVDSLRRAEELVPGFFEIDRIRGSWAAESGDFSAAEEFFASARQQAEDDYEVALVDFHEGCMLVDGPQDNQLASERLRRAHETLQTTRSHYHYGRALAHTSRADEALYHLRGVADEAIGTLQDLAIASLLSLARRDATVNFRVLDGLSLFDDYSSDRLPLHESVREHQRLVGAAIQLLATGTPGADALASAVEAALSREWRVLVHSPLWADLGRIIDRGSSLPASITAAISEAREFMNRPLTLGEECTGFVRDYSGSHEYGFICTGKVDVFFHRDHLMGVHPLSLIPGREVLIKARPPRKSNHRPPAEFVSDAERAVVSRRVLDNRVAKLTDVGEARELITGHTIFVAPGDDLPGRVGDEVVGDVSLGRGGRAEFAAGTLQTAV